MNQVIRYPRLPALDDLGVRHAVVEASAGTGKTYLLENLVVDLLLRRQADFEKILVVTFTDRATAELCLRLRDKLAAMVHLSSDHPDVRTAAKMADRDCWIIDRAARGRLREALLAFDRATVSTIHSFCRSALSEYAFLNGRLYDEQAVDEEGSFHTAFTEALRQDFSVDSSLRPYLAAWLDGGRSLVELESVLLNCAREMSRTYPARPDLLQPVFDESALRTALQAWPRDVACDDALRDRLKCAGVATQSAKAVVKRLVALSQLIETQGHDLAAFLQGLDQIEKEEWKGQRFDYLLHHLHTASQDPILARVHAACAAIARARVPLLAALAPSFLDRIQTRLRARKRALGLNDFQDMLNLLAERLADDNPSSRLLLATLRQRYRYALIDEFQDTDDVQWFIFSRIFFESRDGHVLTVIGDPKQAIYRFRGADVYTYRRARQAITQQGGGFLRLGKNFRSTQALVDACNALFAPETGFFRSGSDIDGHQAVTCGRPEFALRHTDGRPAPGVVVFDIRPDATADEIRRAHRRRMVDELQRLCFSEEGLVVFDGQKPQRINAGHIFILAFTNQECREVGADLREAGIPHAFFHQAGLFESREAADILDLLRAVVEPQDRRRRARALLTRFFALDLPDLPAFDEADASSTALELLKQWHAIAQTEDFGFLFSNIVAASGIARREVCLNSSERSLTNTLHIFEILQEEAARTHASLRELVEMLGGFINGTRRPPGQNRDLQRLESETQTVQIMTVHAAKGLEADVVFLYGGVEPGRKSSPKVFHDEDGNRVVNLGDLDERQHTLLSQQTEDEESRLLYVALTRARFRMYLPLYPQGAGARKHKGVGARLGPILDRVLEDPRTASLFERVPVACPVEPPPPSPVPTPIVLSSWQPPSFSPVVPVEEYRRIASERAGFVVTSYTGVKRQHGGFMVTEGPAETGAAALDQGSLKTTDLGELERGRISGIFLHAIIEEIPLQLADTEDASAWLIHPELSQLLDRLARQHDREPRQIPHAARMVHRALFSPVRLGTRLVPGLGRQKPVLRETEFLYPIPEKSHPLLGQDVFREGRTWSIERGLCKGFIDFIFEHEGLVYLCDWKGDWLPSWEKPHLDLHFQNNYEVQARLYTMAILRLIGVNSRTAYEDRFGGVLYSFLRGLRSGDPEAGVVFLRPEWDMVLSWQEEMLTNAFWGLS